MQEPKPGRVLLTGGTGFLGSYLGVELLRKGHEVYFLARPDRRLSAASRVEQILDWHGARADLRARARVVEGDVTEPDVATAARRQLPDCVEMVIHCASDTSFAGRNSERVVAVNIGGLERVLDLAAHAGCSAFHHVSTAYVAGRRVGPCPEELGTAHEFHNVYEETKAAGEQIVVDWATRHGVKLGMYRPGIVYGDSVTGRTLSFNALYYPIRTALLLRKLYEADIREHGGRKAAAIGARIEPDGSFYLPIRIEVSEGGGINILPVDWFVSAFFAIMEDAPDGGIFHIVNEGTTKIEEIVALGTALFHVTGVRPCSSEEYHATPRNALETLFESYLEAYGPYIRDRRVFTTENAGPILARRGLACPKLDAEIFRRLMEYAVRVDWAPKLDEKPL